MASIFEEGNFDVPDLFSGDEGAKISDLELKIKEINIPRLQDLSKEERRRFIPDIVIFYKGNILSSELILSDYLINIGDQKNNTLTIPEDNYVDRLLVFIDLPLEVQLEALYYLDLFMIKKYNSVLNFQGKVFQFWSVINDKYVPYLIKRFQNSHQFGVETPSYTAIPDWCQREDGLIRSYNEEDNQKYNLPKKINHINDLIPYHRQLMIAWKTILNENCDRYLSGQDDYQIYVYKWCLEALSSEYTDFGIDFSQQGPAYRYRPLPDDEIESFRLMIRQLMEHTRQYDDYLLKLPETYDLILKDSSRDFNPENIKYGLFLAYLDEFYTKGQATENSRYILSFSQIQDLIQTFPENINKGIILSSFFPLPFIPKRENRLFHTFESVLLSKYELEETILRLNKLPTLPDYKGVRYNINGSSLTKALSKERDFGEYDFDIRLDANESIPEDLFLEAVEHYVKEYQLQNLTRVQLNTEDQTKFKFHAFDEEKKKYEFYRSSFGFIGNYHVPAVRMNYRAQEKKYIPPVPKKTRKAISPIPQEFRGELDFYPSAVVALITGICLDLRYFTTKDTNPMKIVQKYYQRGFSFFLSNLEMNLYIEYLAKNVDLEKFIFNYSRKEGHFGDYLVYVPPSITDTEYRDFITSKKQTNFAEVENSIPEKFKEIWLQNKIFLIQQKLRKQSKIKYWIRSTISHLA